MHCSPIGVLSAWRQFANMYVRCCSLIDCNASYLVRFIAHRWPMNMQQQLRLQTLPMATRRPQPIHARNPRPSPQQTALVHEAKACQQPMNPTIALIVSTLEIQEAQRKPLLPTANANENQIRTARQLYHQNEQQDTITGYVASNMSSGVLVGP
jgi:hypothetical protein